MKARLFGIGFGILLIIAAFALVVRQGANIGNGIALAQTGVTETPTPAAGATAMPSTAPSTAPQQQQQQNIGDTFWGILAGKLNVDPATLKADALAARQQMLDQAVTDGRITQAQADALKQKLTSNGLIAPIALPRNGQVPGNNQPNGQQPNGQGPFRRGPFPGFGGRFGGGYGNRAPGGFGGFGPMMGGGAFMGGGLDQLNAVAKVLNLDPKALIEQLSQGKTLSDVAKAQNVDEATVKQAIITYRTSQIDQLLSDGLISQVQADQMKARLTPDNIDLTRPLFFGFRGMPQMNPNMMPNGSPNASPSATPTTSS